MVRETSSWEGLRLYTDRLYLRTPIPRDANALYDLFTDSEVMHGLGKEPVSAPAEARAIVEEWIAAWRTDALGPFVIETAATNEVVGQAGLMIFDTRGWTPSSWAEAGDHAQPELGWALIQAHWGRGYATEAAEAVIGFGFEALGLNKIHAAYFIKNPASARVIEKLGMTYEGHLREHDLKWGVYEDIKVHAILAREWAARREHRPR